jgi:predicted P-loop ATPase
MGDVGRAVQAAARHQSFHPVRDYLGQLVWDGKPRLDRWLETYFHAEDHAKDSAYLRAVGPRWLISAVARIRNPGCKVDHILVLEGDQGLQKTEALRALAVNKEWFAERLSHLNSKDAAQEMAGVWIIEVSEMDRITRASAATAKSFLSRPNDRYRPPHGKHIIDRPRQCVFAGTINPLAGGYLKDPTGARRFWPVACRGRIDRNGLEADRDQLWAEAVQRYDADAPWWLETPELEALATVEQDARFETDIWEEPIREWIARIDLKAGIAIPEVFRALGLAPEQCTQMAMNRVSRILTKLEIDDRHRPRTPDALGGRQRRYYPRSEQKV